MIVLDPELLRLYLTFAVLPLLSASAIILLTGLLNAAVRHIPRAEQLNRNTSSGSTTEPGTIY